MLVFSFSQGQALCILVCAEELLEAFLSLSLGNSYCTLFFS